MQISAIAQATQPSPPPSELVNSPPPLAQWSLLIAGAAWIGKRAWEYFSKKEAAESQLTSDLVSDLRKVQAQSITSLENKLTELIEKIDLKQSLTTAMSMTQAETQRALTSQTALYSEVVAKIKLLEVKTDAIHSRLDELSVAFPEMSGRRPRPEPYQLSPHE